MVNPTVIYSDTLPDTLRLILAKHDNDKDQELGCRLWTAAVMLCGALRLPHFAGCVKKADRILEIGAGLGTCGFSAAAQINVYGRAANVTITDCALDTLNRLGQTLARYEEAQRTKMQGSSSGYEYGNDAILDKEPPTSKWDAYNISIRRLLWEEDLEYVEAKRENRPMYTTRHWSKARDFEHIPTLSFDETYDLILGSDILYFACHEQPLLASLDLRLRPKGTVAILQTMRTNNVMVFERFIEAAKKVFQVEVQDIVAADVCSESELANIHKTHHEIGHKLVTFRKYANEDLAAVPSAEVQDILDIRAEVFQDPYGLGHRQCSNDDPHAVPSFEAHNTDIRAEVFQDPFAIAQPSLT